MYHWYTIQSQVVTQVESHHAILPSHTFFILSTVQPTCRTGTDLLEHHRIGNQSNFLGFMKLLLEFSVKLVIC